MKRDIDHLTKQIFKDKTVLLALGFTPLEAEIFYDVIKGMPISKIAERLKMPYREVRNIKIKRFHLISVLLQRKIDQISKIDFDDLTLKLNKLHEVLNNYVTAIGNGPSFIIEDLGLDRRTLNALRACNVKNTDDLISYSANELLAVKNIGKKAIKAIETALSDLDLKLKE